MKSRSAYTQEKQTALFAATGAFFAFSNDQFDANVKPDTKYVAFGMGMYCPKDKKQELIDGLAAINAEATQTDLADHTHEQIILRELCNHECFYTGDIEDAIDALEDYPFTRNQIAKVYHDNLNKYSD